jgi:hypothetical protein
MNREWFSHAILIEKGTKINFFILSIKLLVPSYDTLYRMKVPRNLLFRFLDQIRGANRRDLVPEKKIKSEEQILRIKCVTNFLGWGWKMRRFSQMVTKYQVMTPKRWFAPRLVSRVVNALNTTINLITILISKLTLQHGEHGPCGLRTIHVASVSIHYGRI